MEALFRPLRTLCEQEEKKLSQLGQQRSETQQRIDHIQQQKDIIAQMQVQYGQYPTQTANPLLLQNTANMAQILAPMQKNLTRQQILLTQEHQRINGMWRKQLGRQQGIKWLYQKKQTERQTYLDKQEQKQLDDLAGRYAAAY
ncbi:hypothetical protein [Shewanella surugensis]|uniref:Flagellar FliJ protein n=1 Tax=Shewanella surugensis TaxID=212020 RepID=A0ABT0LBS2_9GAMM|nr:hypothetical protein [Shewanella surugensis]MCL1124797.1 hypothetical protein [Shewanella surugensis]